jgi:CPA2 family monovalent cation:H+ antiporter-2
MVLLSTVAVSNSFQAGSELLYSVLKLIFFLDRLVLLELSFIPTLLKKAKTLID